MFARHPVAAWSLIARRRNLTPCLGRRFLRHLMTPPSVNRALNRHCLLGWRRRVQFQVQETQKMTCNKVDQPRRHFIGGIGMTFASAGISRAAGADTTSPAAPLQDPRNKYPRPPSRTATRVAGVDVQNAARARSRGVAISRLWSTHGPQSAHHRGRFGDGPRRGNCFRARRG